MCLRRSPGSGRRPCVPTRSEQSSCTATERTSTTRRTESIGIFRGNSQGAFRNFDGASRRVDGEVARAFRAPVSPRRPSAQDRWMAAGTVNCCCGNSRENDFSRSAHTIGSRIAPSRISSRSAVRGEQKFSSPLHLGKPSPGLSHEPVRSRCAGVRRAPRITRKCHGTKRGCMTW